MTVFPINKSTANKCRIAWANGQKAAKFVNFGIRNSKQAKMAFSPDTIIQFKAASKGSEVQRVSNPIFNAASALGIVVNHELCDCLSDTLENESTETLTWVLDQIKWDEDAQDGKDISGKDLNDITLISAFCVFQAFFMGYYYDIFLRLVDVSSLRLRVVAGDWGFRSSKFLIHMRSTLRMTNAQGDPTEAGKGMKSDDANIYSREQVIIILASLFCNHTPASIPRTREEICLE
jgi:hypothetical protein